MKYFSVAEFAKKWNLSERTVRNYCAQGKITDAFLTGKTWNIPENSVIPNRINKHLDVPSNLLDVLIAEMRSKGSGGIYQKVQIELTYNSNHIEGSKLSHEQTRYIFETNTIGIDEKTVNIDDIIETTNHFRCIDLIIENANRMLTEKLILELHSVLKTGTSDARKDWFNVGRYKRLPNEVGGNATVSPEDVACAMKNLLEQYNAIKEKTLVDIIDFHYKFENIHPFQDGNGRIGRLIMFKECLKCGIVPFIIEDEIKYFYYRGLKEWKNEKEFLTDTCLAAQDKFKKYLDYFKIPY